MTATNIRFQILSSLRADSLNVRQNDDTRPSQGANRLAKNTSREKPTFSPRVRCIDEQNIEIPAEPPMLKGIVEDDDLTFEFLISNLCECHAIGSLQVRNVRKILFQ